MGIPSNLPEFHRLYDKHHSSRWIVQAHLRTSDEQRKLPMVCGEYSGGTGPSRVERLRRGLSYSLVLKRFESRRAGGICFSCDHGTWMGRV